MKRIKTKNNLSLRGAEQIPRLSLRARRAKQSQQARDKLRNPHPRRSPRPAAGGGARDDRISQICHCFATPLAGLAMTVWSLAFASELPSLEEVADRLQKSYEQISGFQAEFHQKTFRQDGSLALEARGTLSYQRPNQMRWDYNPPEEQQVIIDGKKLWIYYPKERQVLVQPLAEGLPSTPLYLLAGVAEFEKEFETSWSSPKEDGEGYHLQLKPKGEIPGVYQLVVDSKKYLISRMVSVDPIGYKTEWRFQRIQVAPSFPKDFFKFTPPKGVEILQAP